MITTTETCTYRYFISDTFLKGLLACIYFYLKLIIESSKFGVATLMDGQLMPCCCINMMIAVLPLSFRQFLRAGAHVLIFKLGFNIGTGL